MRPITFKNAQPKFQESTVEIKGLSPAFDGFRVLFFTDTHLGPFFDRKALQKMITRMGELQFDAILIGGDNAESEEEQRIFFEEVARLEAPCGIFCVPGNNDRECFPKNMAKMRSCAAQNGVKVLINEGADIVYKGEKLALYGTDEPKYGKPLSPKNMETPYILLTHSPGALRLLDMEKHQPALILAGHTHAGQIAIGPLSVYLFSEHNQRVEPWFRFRGEHDIQGTRLIVSNGIGMSLLPLRIGAEPMAHIITLRGK